MATNATQVIAQIRGDYGNPSGSGLAKIVVHDLGAAQTDAETTKTAMKTFADALKTAHFTECNVGDITLVDKNLNFPGKPASDVNVDRKIEVTWRTVQDDSIRSLTISGIDEDATVLEAGDDGKRLTDAAKLTLGGYLTTLFALEDPDGALVLYGKYIVTY